MVAHQRTTETGRMSERTVGITGPQGFVASHLARRLAHQEGIRVVTCHRESFGEPAALAAFADQCDTIVHLAGMNRGEDEEIYLTNTRLADQLIQAAERSKRKTHIIFSSSTQRDRDNAYGRSKKYGENQLNQWAASGEGRAATILVIPNVYGPGCRPFYNSVVATFCYELAQGKEPTIIQDSEVEFVWINDLVDIILEAIENPPHGAQTQRVADSSLLKVSDLLAKLRSFRESHSQDDMVPDISDPLSANLYATYLSYVSLKEHCHRPEVHRDDRGHLFEIIRMANGGQVFFSTTKPGIVRGNHYHTRKIEWFCVLKGEAAIRLRRVDDDSVHEFRVSGDSPQFISIPVLHTHQIENVGDRDLLTMFWCNEVYTADDPDTYFEKVA